MKTLLTALIALLIGFAPLSYADTANTPALTESQNIEIADMFKLQLIMNELTQHVQKLVPVIPTKDDYAFAVQTITDEAYPILHPPGGNRISILIEAMQAIVAVLNREDLTNGQKAAIFHQSLDLFAKTIQAWNKMTVAEMTNAPAGGMDEVH